MIETKIFDEAYKKLNKAQKEAVDKIDGPVSVIAGPGTGKTQILALRIGNILLKTDTSPENILALTYTTAGVISMRKRLLEIIGDRAYRVHIYTFHAFCEHVIKEFPFYFTSFNGARVIQDLERVEIIETIIKNNTFAELVSFFDEFSFLSKIADAILTIKHEGLSAQQFQEKIPEWEKTLRANEDIYYKKDYQQYKKGDIKKAEEEKIQRKLKKVRELGTIFSLYQEELKRLRLYDFSDMVLSVLAELSVNKSLLADMQETYQYILLDEHQDTNVGQNMLVEFLANAEHLEKKPNIFTVGDEKQSIYRFQGASAETFSKFKDSYKSVFEVTLTQNYRSSQSILDGAHSLIVKSPSFEKSIKLEAHKTNNEKIYVKEFSNYKFELLNIAEEIKEKIHKGISPSEIAVLYRANKNVRDIKTIFDFYQIPYTIFSKDPILEDPNIRNLILLLKVIQNPNDDHVLGKALFAKFLSFDAYDCVKILDAYKSIRKNERKHIFSILESEKTLKNIEVKHEKQFLEFVKNIKSLKIESENNYFLDFFKIFLEKIGYIQYMLASSDSRLQLVKLDKFLDEIKKQSNTKKSFGLEDFIYFVDSFAKYNLDIQTTDPEVIEGVSLMTAHGAKGREFEHVYIINATRKSWENRRASGNTISLPIYQYDGDLEDERRLFYVAMTRAKTTLTISFSRTDNDGREHEVSEFVNEIDPECVEFTKMKHFEETHLDTLTAFLNAEKGPASLFDPKYIRVLFFERGLNVSALNNYLDCPKKYLYKNLIRIPDTYSKTMHFGEIIHSALEMFCRRSLEHEAILSKEVLLNEFYMIMDNSFLPEKEEKEFKQKGEKLLGEYYDYYHTSWTHRVKVEFGPKRNFQLETKELLQLTGKIDKVEYRDEDFIGGVNLIDYKTGKPFSEKTKEQKADYERQIVFYHLLLEEYENIKIEKSTLSFLEKNKKGEFEEYTIAVSKKHLETLRQEINDFADDVLSMEFLKKGCNKKECQWCALHV